MTAGLRDQRLAVYAPVETLTDGVTSRAYVLAETWWARLEPPTGREVTTGWAPEHQVDGVVVFAAEAVIAPADLLVDEDGQVWEVRAILPRVRHANQQVLVQRSDLTVDTYTLAAS